MMYLWPQAGSMRGMHHRFGVITTAAHGCVPAGIKEGRLWAFDNECFRRPFDYQRWLAHWHRLFPYSKRCLFVVVPDKPFDAQATLALWHEWHALIRKQLDRFDNLAHVRKPWLGLAFAAQDGQESLPPPEEADWVFIAGSTEWKLSDAAASVMQRAWDAGMYIHVGRVNSQRRYRYFRRLADRLDLDIVSCDGTAVRFHPAQALRRLTDVIEETSPPLR
jgi:urease beta subunit